MQVSIELENGAVEGFCEPAFEPLLNRFVENFKLRNELGASLCLYLDGTACVDLWGGMKSSRAEAEPWTRDTISILFSCTKAATALCAHKLIDDGDLDLNAPVSAYWPEFAANGKQDTTVAMMLNHSSGVPALRAPVKEHGFCDWDYMVDRLSAEQPFWTPGTRNGYHMMTFGWTVGELVRRVSGESLGQYFRKNIAEPLGLDFWIGLPDSEFERMTRMLQWKPEKGVKPAPFTAALLKDPTSLQYLALLNSGKHKADSPESYRAEIGAGGGIGNARSLAGMYNPLALGGEADGVRLLSSDHIERMRAVSVATSEDATLLMPSRFGLGFMRSMDNRYRPSGDMESCVLGREAFGHAGAGGSIGFADPEAGLAFGYSMNRMGAGILLNQRGQTLVDETYRCLGYRTDAPGFWIK